MALATTTLSAACAQADNTIVVTSATSMAAGRLIVIDQETMQVVQTYVSGTTVGVLRGRDGSAQIAHKVTANVTHGLGSDFALPGNQGEVTYQTQRPVLVQSVSATSTLVLPPAGCDLRLILNGTSAITLTIPVPTKDMDGCELTIVGNGAAAHVPTFTGGLSGAGASYDALTVNATAPIAMKAIACNGVWVAVSAPGWTGTVTAITGGIA